MKRLKNVLFPALGLVILIAVLLPSLSDARGFGFKFFFAKRVAGSYLGEVEAPPGSPPLPTIFNFHSDRTAIFTGPNPGAALGPWKRAGHHKIEGTFVLLQNDPGGLLIGIAVFTHVTTFSEDFRSFAAEGVARIFQCPFIVPTGPECPDPFDINSVPIAEIPFEVNAQRIPAVQNN